MRYHNITHDDMLNGEGLSDIGSIIPVHIRGHCFGKAFIFKKSFPIF